MCDAVAADVEKHSRNDLQTTYDVLKSYVTEPMRQNQRLAHSPIFSGCEIFGFFLFGFRMFMCLPLRVYAITTTIIISITMISIIRSAQYTKEIDKKIS